MELAMRDSKGLGRIAWNVKEWILNYEMQIIQLRKAKPTKSTQDLRTCIYIHVEDARRIIISVAELKYPYYEINKCAW